MKTEDYLKRMIEILNLTAGEIVRLQKMNRTAAAILIMKKTGSDYLAEKYDRDFAGRYLNSDSGDQRLWLKYLGIDEPQDMDCYIMRQVMLYFNNNSLNTPGINVKKEYNLNPYGTGENWCKLWLKLSDDNKKAIVTHFHN